MKKAKLHKLKVPRATWDAFEADTRYSVLLLGQIFNETIMLHKLCLASRPGPDTTIAQTHAMFAQMSLLARLLCGKIYEAHKALTAVEVKRFFFEVCFPLMPEGKGRELLKTFNRDVSTCRWLANARNGHAMHFPDSSQWAHAMSAMKDRKREFELIMGDTVGDSYFSSSADVAAISFYLEADSTDWQSGLQHFSDDVMKMTQSLNALIRHSLDAFFLQLLAKEIPKDRRAKIKNAKSFDRPAMRDCRIPFFLDFTEYEPSFDAF